MRVSFNQVFVQNADGSVKFCVCAPCVGARCARTSAHTHVVSHLSAVRNKPAAHCPRGTQAVRRQYALRQRAAPLSQEAKEFAFQE